MQSPLRWWVGDSKARGCEGPAGKGPARGTSGAEHRASEASRPGSWPGKDPAEAQGAESTRVKANTHGRAPGWVLSHRGLGLCWGLLQRNAPDDGRGRQAPCTGGSRAGVPRLPRGANTQREDIWARGQRATCLGGERSSPLPHTGGVECVWQCPGPMQKAVSSLGHRDWCVPGRAGHPSRLGHLWPCSLDPCSERNLKAGHLEAACG